MDQVSPDLLLMIFKELNSKEMVSVMRVERKWLQVIDEHKSLWRELVLPSNENEEEKGRGLQALKLFTRKSNNTLKRVSMDVTEGVEVDAFIETLEKSKDSLQFLAVKEKHWNRKVTKRLEENLWNFSKLIDCRLLDNSNNYYELKLQVDGRDEDQEDSKGSSLRVLWINGSDKLLRSHVGFLDNLVSLILREESYGSLGIRRILERPSRTLKHLEIEITPEEGEEPQIPTLDFPHLKFLDIAFYNDFGSAFPSWMRLPSLSTLTIWKSRTLSSLPACSKLWLVGLNELDSMVELASQCPGLVQLTMDLSPRSIDPSTELPASERFENLSSMLSQRRANVEAGREIQGVKMVKLKTLVVPFWYLGLGGRTGSKGVGLSKLTELVEEVVDLDEAQSEIIEMEV